jgi:hypothetical protein
VQALTWKFRGTLVGMADTPKSITIEVHTVPAVQQALAEAWEAGRRTGHSRAMRKMSDEPNLDLADFTNPYTVEQGGWCAPSPLVYDLEEED